MTTEPPDDRCITLVLANQSRVTVLNPDGRQCLVREIRIRIRQRDEK